MVLVNLAHPTVVEELLRRHGEEIDAEPWIEGLVSSVAMRHFTTPEDPVLHAFLAHEPDPAERELVQRWRRMVSEPCSASLAGTADSGGAPVAEFCRQLGTEVVA